MWKSEAELRANANLKWIVGNFADNEKERVVSYDEAKEFADSFGNEHVSCS